MQATRNMVQKTTSAKRTTRASKTTQQAKMLAIPTWTLSASTSSNPNAATTTNLGHLADSHSANLTG